MKEELLLPFIVLHKCFSPFKYPFPPSSVAENLPLGKNIRQEITQKLEPVYILGYSEQTASNCV